MKNKSSIDTKDQPKCLCIDPIFWNEPCPAHPDKTTPTAPSNIDDLLSRLIHCQKMIDAGIEGWSDYANEMIDLRRNKIPDEIRKVLASVSITIDEKPTGEPTTPHKFYLLDGSQGLDWLVEAVIPKLQAHIAEHYVPKAEVTRARIDELENRLRVQFISSHWERLRSETNSWAKYVDRRIDELKATLNTKEKK